MAGEAQSPLVEWRDLLPRSLFSLTRTLVSIDSLATPTFAGLELRACRLVALLLGCEERKEGGKNGAAMVRQRLAPAKSNAATVAIDPKVIAGEAGSVKVLVEPV